jgi:hypothetical protein
MSVSGHYSTDATRPKAARCPLLPPIADQRKQKDRLAAVSPKSDQVFSSGCESLPLPAGIFIFFCRSYFRPDIFWRRQKISRIWQFPTDVDLRSMRRACQKIILKQNEIGNIRALVVLMTRYRPFAIN